jgi:hypothetical protein
MDKILNIGMKAKVQVVVPITKIFCIFSQDFWKEE